MRSNRQTGKKAVKRIIITAIVIGLICALIVQTTKAEMYNEALDNTLDAKVFELQAINDEIKALRAEQQTLCKEMGEMRPVSLGLYCD